MPLPPPEPRRALREPPPRRTWRWLLPSLRTALVVGTLLTAINQGNRLRAGAWSGELVLRILMNLAVPFSVSAYSRRSAEREGECKSAREVR